MASSLLIHVRLGSIRIFTCLFKGFTALGVRLRRLLACLFCWFACFARWLQSAALSACRLLAASVDPVWVLLFYFVCNSFMGFLLLRILAPKGRGRPPLRDLDLFFTSVSAATVSSMSTVEMEALSRGQLAVVGLLMLTGGEVFTSMLHLHLTKAKLLKEPGSTAGRDTGRNKDGNYQIELGQMLVPPQLDVEATDDKALMVDTTDSDWELKYKSVTLLGIVVLWYNVVFIFLGSASILLYLAFVSGSSAKDVLRTKSIHVLGFSIFLSVSSFTNCGFVPTNENMLPFRKDSWLLLLVIPLLLAGNTLFPAFLRSALGVLRRLLRKRTELFDYILSQSDGRQLGFHHLLSKPRCIQLVLTAMGFLIIQFILFCCMEWNSGSMSSDMSAPEKVVAVLFQSVNSRHAGESIFDMSTLSPAIMVLYMIMMYLPPYTSFSPAGDEASTSETKHSGKGKKNAGLQPGSLILSPVSCIAIFVILVCITERRKLAEDPLNFNILSVVVEVVSAYGNVGFSAGYSCGRQLTPESGCKDEWYGFVGRWSGSGKLILVAVMFFGRLKKFNKRGGRAWKLS